MGVKWLHNDYPQHINVFHHQGGPGGGRWPFEHRAAPIVGVSSYSEVLYFYAPLSCLPKKTNNSRAETVLHTLPVTRCLSKGLTQQFL